MTLEALGWSSRRQEEFKGHAAEGLVPGRVVGEHRSHYQVATDATELSAGTTGRLRNTAEERSDLPGVGDFVALRLAEGDGPATIEAVLPRTSALVRKAAGEPRPQLLAANIDVVFIVTALGGDFNLARVQRYLALVLESGATPVIVVNKADLPNDVIGPTGQIEGIDPGVAIHAISARAQDGARDLEQYFAGQPDCGPCRLVRRRQVDIDEPAAGTRGAGDAGGPSPRRSRPAYDNPSPAVHTTGRRRDYRHARPAWA